jgi:peptide/nickel transport system substrate-binding protein
MNSPIESTAHATDTRLTNRVLFGVARLHPRARQIFLIALVLFLFSTIALILTASSRFYVDVPVKGGTLNEGIIERPRFINPVLAKSNADRNMTSLVYSGLVRMSPNGQLIPDLADNWTVSDDGLTYTFTLKDNLNWQDGEPITSADVAYTIEKIEDPGLAIKSPRRASWTEVMVATPDPRTVIFTLKQPYAPFLENTTVGILPKHIWERITDEEFDVSYYNIDPIGSGPYRISKIVQDTEKGLPLSYELTAFPGFALGEPYISTLSIRFFGNNKDLLDAYHKGTITQFPTVDPEIAKGLEAGGARVTRMHLPLIDAAFFNQNQQPIFAEKAVRQALALAVNKDRIVSEVLLGYGHVIDGPISGLLVTSGTTTPAQGDVAEAQKMLDSAGWKRASSTNLYTKTDKKKKTTTTLSFSITVPDVSELKHAAELLKEDWAALGADVEVKVFEIGTFGSEVLAQRKYDILLYGIIGRPSDPYPYWHSSQRNAPGANIAMYTSRPADDLLEKIRKTGNGQERNDLLIKFESTVLEDMPAVFIYSPDFLYATSRDVHGMTTETVSVESDRFLGVYDWYLESERVWKFLVPYSERTPAQESRLTLYLRHLLNNYR